MVMKKVVFYYENENGELMKATLDGNQYYYAVQHCHDLNSLMAFIDTVTKWVGVEASREKPK